MKLLKKTVNMRNAPALVPYHRCAAKTTDNNQAGTSVMDHCINAGHVADVLVKQLPDTVLRLLPENPALCVSLHDVGKVSPGFQLKYFRDTVVRKYAPELTEQTSFSTSHACIGAAALDSWLKTKPLKSSISVAVASHHGTLDRSYPPDNASVCGGMAWAAERRKLIEALCTEFGASIKKDTSDHSLLAGLTCVADWIASDEEFFPADGPSKCDAHEAVSACGFVGYGIRNDLSFKDIFEFAPRTVQNEFIECVKGPGVYILEAPMGIGKTEAALYATYKLMEAGHHNGFYFALPTRLTSDRIHERVAAFLAKISKSQVVPRLAHGMAWLREYAKGGEAMAPCHSWFNPMKRALLFPYAVGTIDQALLAVINVKHSFVRLFGLAGKVVILDEVHSYDMYTGTLLDELVKHLQAVGCSVIILSATLNAKRRKSLIPAVQDDCVSEAYPLVTGLIGSKPFALPLPAPTAKYVRVRMETWDIPAVAAAAATAAQQGQCVVCIANTVAKAQSWYRALKSEMPRGAFLVGLLHARFPLAVREELERKWMGLLGKAGAKRPAGCVLIATQIVEQSVDIDADWMISELAPTDMLLQRIGRLWRHERERPCSAPELVVVANNPAGCTSEEKLFAVLGKENCRVYAPYVLLRSYNVWKEQHKIVLPNDVRTLIEATYSERQETDLLLELRRALERRREKLRALALSAKVGVEGMPTASDDDKAATRYSDLPTGVVLIVARIVNGTKESAVVRLLDGTELGLNSRKPDFEATRKLHAQTVSVARYLLPSYIRRECGWLRPHFYDEPFVLICEESGQLTCYNGEKTVLCYSPEWGVYLENKGDIAAACVTARVEVTEDDIFKSDW